MEWKNETLAEVIEVNPTERLPKLNVAKKIAMENIIPFTKKINSFSQEPYNGGVKFRNGDTLIARITPSLENGKTSFVDILDNDEVGFGSTEFIVLRAIDGFTDPHFVYYHSITPEFREVAIQSMTGTSGRQRVQNDSIKNFDVLLPSLKEQEQIAEVLSCIDDKIDLLHHQNKTLEAMAETIFRQWFIEQAEDDWKIEPLDSIIDFNPRYKLSKGTDAIYLEMSNVSENSFHPKDWYIRTFASGTKFMNGDTLLARITPCLENGKTCFVYFLNDEEVGWGSTEYIVMRMKPGYHPFLSYIIAKNEEFRDFAESSMTGSSGRQRAQADVIKTFEIQIPPQLIIDKLNEQVDSIFDKLKNNATQIKSLETLRDTLLPKLMSGEVRVKN